MKRFLIGVFIGSSVAVGMAQSPVAIRVMPYVSGTGLANGVIRVPSGTTAANAIGIGAANTGFYSSSANLVSMVTNGTTQILFGGGVVRMGSTTQFGWASGGADATAIDAMITRGGATLFNFTDAAGTTGIQINSGSGQPGFTSTQCATGTITTGSRNTAGQVTATGATSCGITFASPAWTNAPFCTMSNQTANRGNISTVTTTLFTLTNLTAGDVVTWNCLGRI